MDNNQTIIQSYFDQGRKQLESGDAEGALSNFNAALSLDSSQAVLYLYAGAALHGLNRYEEAVSCYGTAVSLDPESGEIFNNLGNSQLALNRLEDAAASFDRAAELLPHSPVPLTARASALQALGKVSNAESDCRKAIQLDENFAAAHWNLALNLLLQGRYSEGWLEYEWRWQKPDFTSPQRYKNIVVWDGAKLDEKTVVLHAEQGYGDAIQFIRYVPDVVRSGGRVIVECHPQLVNLFECLEGVCSVKPFGAVSEHIDCHVPLLSLPMIFGTTLASVPAKTPYLAASLHGIDKWRSLLDMVSGDLKVGLVWAGKSYPDPRRSCSLDDFAPFGRLNKVTFYSLQIGAGAEQSATPPCGMKLVDQTSHIADFDDTAALIAHLDLVVTIDTAVAHLAGAMGKKVFTLLPFAPDWRWLLDRKKSPWYPEMSLFRQRKAGEWGGVINEIFLEIERLQQKIL